LLEQSYIIVRRGAWLRLVCLHIFDLGCEGSRLTRVVKRTCQVAPIFLRDGQGWVCSRGLSYYTTSDWRKLFRASEISPRRMGEKDVVNLVTQPPATHSFAVPLRNGIRAGP
jgi:hypothetical protein